MFIIGFVYFRVTIYSEFLPTVYRARAIVLLEVFWAWGTILAVTLALLVMPGLGWRYFVFFCALPVLVFNLLCYVSAPLHEFSITSPQCSNKKYSPLHCNFTIMGGYNLLGWLLLRKIASFRLFCSSTFLAVLCKTCGTSHNLYRGIIIIVGALKFRWVPEGA